MVDAPHPETYARRPGDSMVERAGTETRDDRSGEHRGGQPPSFAVSAEDHERGEHDRDHERRLVQDTPQPRLIEQRSGQSPSGWTSSSAEGTSSAAGALRSAAAS